MNPQRAVPAIGHMPFPHRNCAEWTPYEIMLSFDRVIDRSFRSCAPRNTKLIPKHSSYGMER